MKKLFYLLLILPMLIFSSCGGDELPDSLIGTTWEYKVGTGDLSISISYTFTSATAYSFKSETMGESDSYTGTYVYDSSSGKVIFDGGTETEIIGTINDNVLQVSIMDMGSLNFKKK